MGNFFFAQAILVATVGLALPVFAQGPVPGSSYKLRREADALFSDPAQALRDERSPALGCYLSSPDRAPVQGYNKTGMGECVDLRNRQGQSNAELKTINWKGRNLRGANLDGLDLRGIDLSGSDLTGASLRGTLLEGAILKNTKLADISCAKTSFKGTDLRDADLGLIYFTPFSYDSPWQGVRVITDVFQSRVLLSPFKKGCVPADDGAVNHGFKFFRAGSVGVGTSCDLAGAEVNEGAILASTHRLAEDGRRVYPKVDDTEFGCGRLALSWARKQLQDSGAINVDDRSAVETVGEYVNAPPASDPRGAVSDTNTKVVPEVGAGSPQASGREATAIK